MTLSQWIDYALTFVLVGLAVYRMSVMVAMESGPGDILDKMRKLFPRGGFLAKLTACPFCLSIWFGLAGACVLPYYTVAWFVVTWLALSAFATLLVKRFG